MPPDLRPPRPILTGADPHPRDTPVVYRAKSRTLQVPVSEGPAGGLEIPFDTAFQGMPLAEPGRNAVLGGPGRPENDAMTLCPMRACSAPVSKSGQRLKRSLARGTSSGATPRRCPDIGKMRAMGYAPSVALVLGIARTVA